MGAAGDRARRLARRARDAWDALPRRGSDDSELKALVAAVSHPIEQVVLVQDTASLRSAQELAALLPSSRIAVLAPATPPDPVPDRIEVRSARSASDVVEQLAVLPQPQLIIDLSSRGLRESWTRCSQFFFFLATGGSYACPLEREESEDAAAAFDRLQAAQPAKASKHLATELAAACAPVDFAGDHLVLRKQLDHRYGIRESAANDLLQRRYGTSWGEVVSHRPARRYISAAVVTTHFERTSWHGEDEAPRTGLPLAIPDQYLRRYESAVCWFRQRVAMDEYWLPDTYRHHLNRHLAHRALITVNGRHARLKDDPPRRAREVAGPLFYFDTEFPGHFGHVLTEVLSRYWGWQEARQREPDLRPLVSLRPESEGIPQYQRDLFAALDIDPDSVEYVRADEYVRVRQSLYAATPAFVMPQYVDPDLGAVWSRVAAIADGLATTQPRRLFIGRGVRNIRSCLNTDEVEAFFASLGFAIVRPEQFSFAEQIAMFRNADLVAGFGGSGMFSMMFAPHCAAIVITPDTYTATNEFLIASVTGAEVHYFQADAEIKHPPGGWTYPAFQSNYTFDVHANATAITDVVEAAAASGDARRTT